MCPELRTILKMVIKQLIFLCILQLSWSLPQADNSSKILVDNDVHENQDDNDDVVQCKEVFANAGLNYCQAPWPWP